MILECPGCHSRYDVSARPAGTQTRCRCGTVFTVPAPSESGASLSCPNCGAGLSPNDASCPYCRTALALAACPRCFGRVFQGNGFCPHCGSSIDAPALATLGGASQRLCPRCLPEMENHLTAHLLGDTLLDECHHCGGLWIDRSAFERLVQDRQRQTTLLSLGLEGAASASTTATAVPPLRYLRCPDCGVLMNRKNFGGRSGVIVEVCKPHGIWFDRDQLSAALRFVMAGGLEETKRRQLEETLAQQRPHAPVSLPHGMAETTWQDRAVGVAELGELVLGALHHLFH